MLPSHTPSPQSQAAPNTSTHHTLVYTGNTGTHAAVGFSHISLLLTSLPSKQPGQQPDHPAAVRLQHVPDPTPSKMPGPPQKAAECAAPGQHASHRTHPAQTRPYPMNAPVKPRSGGMVPGTGRPKNRKHPPAPAGDTEWLLHQHMGRMRKPPSRLSKAGPPTATGKEERWLDTQQQQLPCHALCSRQYAWGTAAIRCRPMRTLRREHVMCGYIRHAALTA